MSGASYRLMPRLRVLAPDDGRRHARCGAIMSRRAAAPVLSIQALSLLSGCGAIISRRAAAPVLSIQALSLLSGCGGGSVQSVLEPAGPAAAEIAWLWWLMLVLGTIVFVATVALLGIALFRRRWKGADGPPLGSFRFVLLAGLVVPAIILIVLLVFTLRTTVSLRMPETSLTIQVVGHQFWWEVTYPSAAVTNANEIHIPAGVPVRLLLRAADVIHSLWIPRLHGKMDLLPDHDTQLWIMANEPDTFWGQCGEFCGVQHAHMRLTVRALPQEEFERWLEDAAQPAPAPRTPEQQRGLEVFMTACAHCHAIDGTDAEGLAGPDLTLMGSRQTIGAGTRPNTRANLSQWIRDPQPMKPGNLMPPTILTADDLDAVVAYMQSLR
jgi:cytochrome c oxidase subunit II